MRSNEQAMNNGLMSDGLGPNDVELPLVSIIITAHDYGQFLKAAIASALAQSYRDIECIVVDDASTDDTGQILAGAKLHFPAISVITNPNCLGQGGACRVGLKASRGQYIVFMDADDVLDPDFVRDHVYVNLSSRVHVGFTSSDVYQVVDGQLVVATGEALNAYILANSPPAPSAFRPLERAPAGLGATMGRAPNFWSMSAPFPRRKRSGAGRQEPRTCFGATHSLSLRIVTSSIEMRLGADALSLYRRQYFLRQPLGGQGAVDVPDPWRKRRNLSGSTTECSRRSRRLRTVRQAKELLIRYLTRDAVAVSARLWRPETLLLALDRLESDLGTHGPQSCLSQCVERYETALSSAIGEARLARWISGRAPRPRRSWWRNPFRGRI